MGSFKHELGESKTVGRSLWHAGRRPSLTEQIPRSTEGLEIERSGMSRSNFGLGLPPKKRAKKRRHARVDVHIYGANPV